jgi:hypothetical protein
VLSALAALVGVTACGEASGGTTGGGAGTSNAGSGAVGTAGLSAGGAATGGTTGNGGGTPSAGGNVQGENAGFEGVLGGAGAGGSSGNSGSSGAGGGSTTTCTGNVISLSANGTGQDSDAAQARVVIDLGTDAPSGAKPRTIAFWMYVKPTDWVGEHNQVFYSGGAGQNTTFGLDFGTNPVMGMPQNHATLDPFTNGSLSVDSTADLGITSAAAQWLHVAMTWDGGSMKTYVNGKLGITSVANAQLDTGAGPLIMGCNPGNSFCFNGEFDELTVYSRALTEQEIKGSYSHTLKGDEQGLVGYFKFDDSASGPATDSVTAAGHTAHSGSLMATLPESVPHFMAPTVPPPITCP